MTKPTHLRCEGTEDQSGYPNVGAPKPELIVPAGLQGIASKSSAIWIRVRRILMIEVVGFMSSVGMVLLIGSLLISYGGFGLVSELRRIDCIVWYCVNAIMIMMIYFVLRWYLRKKRSCLNLIHYMVILAISFSASMILSFVLAMIICAIYFSLDQSFEAGLADGGLGEGLAFVLGVCFWIMLLVVPITVWIVYCIKKIIKI